MIYLLRTTQNTWLRNKNHPFFHWNHHLALTELMPCTTCPPQPARKIVPFNSSNGDSSPPKKQKNNTTNNFRGCGFPRHPKNPMSRNHNGKSGPDKDGSWIGPLMPEAATHSTGGPYVNSIRRDHQQIMTGLEKLNMMWIPWYHWSLPSSKCDTLLGINNFTIPAGTFEDDSYFSSFLEGRPSIPLVLVTFRKSTSPGAEIPCWQHHPMLDLLVGSESPRWIDWWQKHHLFFVV